VGADASTIDNGDGGRLAVHEAYGDPGSGVAAGTAGTAWTAWMEVGEDYHCPVCGTSREGFRMVEKL